MSDKTSDIQLQSIKPLTSTNDLNNDPCPPYPGSQAHNGTENQQYLTTQAVNQAYEPDVEETKTAPPNNESKYEIGGDETLQNHVQQGVRRRLHEGQMDLGDDYEEQYEESSDDDDDYDNAFQSAVGKTRKIFITTYENHDKVFWTVFWLLVANLYFLYFGYAMYKTFDVDDEGSMRLLIVTIIGVVGIVGYFVSTYLLKDRKCNLVCFSNDSENAERMSNIIFWGLIVASAAFIIIFLIVDVARNRPRNLVSAFGMLCFVLFLWVFSKSPGKVNWRPVYWGLVIQFFFALLILRWKFGYQAFDWLGKRVQEFLEHTDAGSSFVFGDKYTDHFFAFKVLTVIVFFSSAVSVLYYCGVMQFIIKYIARFLAFCLGTSPTESLNAAGNIFIGQSEAPLMIRPFLKNMTRSEIHAVCTGGFATIAGSVLAAYISIGVPANHLLSASVMSAPAALAMAKLFYPETKKTRINTDEVYNMPKGQETNFIEALSKGASLSISLIANIAVNLIAFIAALHFLDSTLIWLGHRADRYDPEITFSYICSYVFYPVAWVMGVESGDDCRKVASLIGTKTFLNEFVAYVDLSNIINDTKTYNTYMANGTGINNGTSMVNGDIVLNYYNHTLKYGLMSDRSVTIATYSLCGFSNIGSIGIMIGALGAMAPTRRKDIIKVVVRAMIAGNVACFMTASIAGLLYEGEL